ncbi:transcription factor DIVARICATA-like [Bidens hawaiensis]|uniref:transcription factor DIVARICATA-like n=1 Tax=Bidens hawaiensis TaxID=980011 RepID=UPI00404B49F1
MNPTTQILNSYNFSGTKWTQEENKRFEEALALFDKETPDRWHNVARLIPGKSVTDVINQYRKLEEDISDIEAGVLLVDNIDHATLDQYHPQLINYTDHGGKRSCQSNRLLVDHEKKKGIPWTQKEHRQFLLGLKKYGKGDWRNISRNFVTTRTPTQVASHAQKYFIRQLSGGKDKRRSSIHDITTVNLDHTTKTNHQLPEQTHTTTPPPEPVLHHHHMVKAALYRQWSHPNQQVATNMALMMAPIHGIGNSSYGHLGTVFQGNC